MQNLSSLNQYVTATRPIHTSVGRYQKFLPRYVPRKSTAILGRTE